MDGVLRDLRASVIAGKAKEVEAGVSSALDSGIPVGQILAGGLVEAMAEVGRRFECSELFVPEMLVAARAMKSGLALLRPRLVASGVPTAGKVVMGTVKGDLHDIGKNLVSMMLEGAGYEIVDLGFDVAPGNFVASIQDHSPQIVGMSALLTTTMANMRASIEALEKSGVREKVKVIVGGAPLTEAIACKIGADGYAPDAAQAVALVKSLL